MRLPKSLTTVTAISKMIALVLFVSLFLIGFLLGMKYQKLITVHDYQEEKGRFKTPVVVPTKILPLPTDISCQTDLNCPEKMKCGNRFCVSVSCGKAGEMLAGPVSPEYRKHMITECCQGLTGISYYRTFDQECNPTGWVGAGAVCSDCGNQICESWETKCNCPKDCR